MPQVWIGMSCGAHLSLLREARAWIISIWSRKWGDRSLDCPSRLSTPCLQPALPRVPPFQEGSELWRHLVPGPSPSQEGYLKMGRFTPVGSQDLSCVQYCRLLQEEEEFLHYLNF